MQAVYGLSEALRISQEKMSIVDKKSVELINQAYELTCALDGLQLTVKDRTTLSNKLNVLRTIASDLRNAFKF